MAAELICVAGKRGVGGGAEHGGPHHSLLDGLVQPYPQPAEEALPMQACGGARKREGNGCANVRSALLARMARSLGWLGAASLKHMW